MSSATARPAGPSGGDATGRAPSVRLALGLGLSLLTILGASLYAAHEIAVLRDEQMAVSERHRRDSLELLRIQNNLSTLAVSLRDMMEQAAAAPSGSASATATAPAKAPAKAPATVPSARPGAATVAPPDADRLIFWRNTLNRLRDDLTQAIDLERTLAPMRPRGQQQELTDTADRLWAAIDRAFTLFIHDDTRGAAEVIRTSAFPRHAELADSVSQFLIRNTQVEEDAAAAARGVYTRVAREIYLLMLVLLTAVAVTGVLNIASTRRAFNDVKALSAQLRALTWRMLRLQEDMQTSMARELHDEFGQILTAMNMLVGRAKRQLEAAATRSSGSNDGDDAPGPTPREAEGLRGLIRNVEDVQAIAQQTLERIRTASRLLHPVILDDFGLEQAIAWYIDQFSRQHGIETQFIRTGAIGLVPPDASIHLYRIVQEALNNVSRHSGAPRAWVRLTQANGALTLEVEDAGRGLAPDSEQRAIGEPRGIGVTSMRERAELMGGDLTMTRGTSGGVLVRVHVPLASGAPAAPAGVDSDAEDRADGRAGGHADSRVNSPAVADTVIRDTVRHV